MRNDGYTLAELIIIVALIGVAASAAVPGTSNWRSNQRLDTSARSVGGALAHARGQAIKTGNVWIAFFGTDASGAALTDPNGDVVPILLLDDGRPGDLNQNCAIDGGENIVTLPMESEASFGVSAATSRAFGDIGTGSLASGSTCSNGAGGAASWVMFHPKGTPLAFTSSCGIGGIGSGGGGI